jgi:hypothetical protein
VKTNLVALTTATAATADVAAGLGAVTADVTGSSATVAGLSILGTVGALAAQVTLVWVSCQSVSEGWEGESGRHTATVVAGKRLADILEIHGVMEHTTWRGPSGGSRGPGDQ